MRKETPAARLTQLSSHRPATGLLRRHPPLTLCWNNSNDLLGRIEYCVWAGLDEAGVEFLDIRYWHGVSSGRYEPLNVGCRKHERLGRVLRVEL